MTTVNVMPLGDYAAGNYPLGPAVIADNVSFIQIAIQNNSVAQPTIWPNAGDTVSMDLQMSWDNGVTWEPQFQGSSGGGPKLDKFGAEVPFTYISIFPRPGVARRFKGSVTLSATIHTSGNVTQS